MTVELLSEDDIEQAWARARPLRGRDPKLYRISPDIVQAVIRRDQYDICGDYGWRIEHGKPVSYRKSSIEDAIKLVQYEIYAPSRPTTVKTTANRKN